MPICVFEAPGADCCEAKPRSGGLSFGSSGGDACGMGEWDPAESGRGDVAVFELAGACAAVHLVSSSTSALEIRVAWNELTKPHKTAIPCEASRLRSSSTEPAGGVCAFLSTLPI
jgi:hypothetical protein